MKLKETTKLSSRTLDKHLDYMTSSQIIEKKTDVINGKHAALFKIKPEALTYYNSYTSREKFVSVSKKLLNEKKDPLIILDAIHATTQVFFIQLIELIQQNKNITNDEINFFGDCFLWTNYKRWISELVESSRKIISEINTNELLAKQAIRQIGFNKDLLEKIKTAKNKH